MYGVQALKYVFEIELIIMDHTYLRDMECRTFFKIPDFSRIIVAVMEILATPS